MSLIEFWPTLQNCLDCIKPEAENPSDAVFLGVHQKMRFVRKSFATEQKDERSEIELLDEFLKADPSGRIILPVLGESGIGKSHLIRWLDVQLRLRDDHNKRHVIRIPKSSSLKSVLGKILDGLEGNRFQEIREQLKSAREKMDDIDARNSVRAKLLTAIERKFAIASERKAKTKISGGAISEEDKLWIGHGDSRALRAIFNDPATDRLFMEGTPERPGIILEISRHLTKDTKKEEKAPRRLFEEADFQIPESLAEYIHQNASSIASKYLQRLEGFGGKDREIVVRLLNKIVDDAIKPLATPADTSLSELFYEVRKQLLAEDKELVLLVEDFAVLAGVQGALLDAMNKEGVVNGKTEACTIRTAIAVTDGYWNDIDTSKTRAVHGWWIEATASDDEDHAIDRIADFIAAYANVARIGATRLEKHYVESFGRQYETPNASKVLELSENDCEAISHFGYSSDQLPLFPFNRYAIAELADLKLRKRDGDPLRFHPRSIINEIILPTLRNYRSDFEQKLFPPENFLDYAKNRFQPDLIQEVRRHESDAQTQWRLLYLLRFWGGNPSKTVDSKVPVRVFEVFGLKPIDPNSKVAVPGIKKSTTGGQGDPTPTPNPTTIPPKTRAEDQTEQEPSEIADFLKRLERWREGTPETALSSGDSNKLRKMIGETVFDAINWESLLLQKIKKADCSFAWQNTFIPNAKSNQSTEVDAFTIVATEADFGKNEINLQVFMELRALVRFEHYRHWNYRDGENDYARLANFVESRLPSASKWVIDRYQNVKGDLVPALTQCLLWQSRILNIPEAHKADDVNLIAAIFQLEVPRQQKDDDLNWQNFLKECEIARPIVFDLLIDRVAARQGYKDDGKVHAIDVAQLLACVKELKKEWVITEAFPKLPNNPSDCLQNGREHCNNLVRRGAIEVRNRRKRVLDESKQVIKELGESFDKNELVKTFGEIIEASKNNSLSGTDTSGKMKQLLDAFRDSPSKDVLDQIKVIEQNETGGAMLSAIASLDGETHKTLVEFAETGALYISDRIEQAKSRIGDWTDEVVSKKIQEVDSLLGELSRIASEFSGVRS